MYIDIIQSSVILHTAVPDALIPVEILFFVLNIPML